MCTSTHLNPLNSFTFSQTPSETAQLDYLEKTIPERHHEWSYYRSSIEDGITTWKENIDNIYQTALSGKSGKKYFSIRDSQPISEKILYHGSPSSFDRVSPSFSLRSSQGKVNWIGTAVFATPDRRIALFYTQNSAEGVSACIDLISPVKKEEPIDFLIIGGASLDDAMDKLYGTQNESIPSGYIYQLDGREFVREEGLGSMEAISYNPDSTLDKKPVSRRREIQKYVDRGLVRLNWIPS